MNLGISDWVSATAARPQIPESTQFSLTWTLESSYPFKISHHSVTPGSAEITTLESTMVKVTLFLTYRFRGQRQPLAFLSFILRDKNISMLFSELCSIEIGKWLTVCGSGLRWSHVNFLKITLGWCLWLHLWYLIGDLVQGMHQELQDFGLSLIWSLIFQVGTLSLREVTRFP